MRLLTLLFILAFITSCSTVPPEIVSSVKIIEIKPRYIESENFRRITEYLIGQEHQGGRIIIRSQPDNHNGYYFTLLLDTSVLQLPLGTKIYGEFVTPLSPNTKEYVFSMPTERPKTNEIFVGLTGEDWPDPDHVPGAWKFTIKSPNDQILGTAHSYLWSM